MPASVINRFTSASAEGPDWRDLCNRVIADLRLAEVKGFKPNIGFLYMTDQLADDADYILDLLKSVTGVSSWTGCIARGVCGAGVEYFDRPAISVMIGALNPDDFQSFYGAPPNFKSLHDLKPWLNKHDAVLAVIHADPRAEAHPAQGVEEIETMVGAFMVGGLSSPADRAIVSHGAMAKGIGGFVFSQNIGVSTALSQGCIPMGPMREISRLEGHVIGLLDGRVPFEVFSEDMKDMTAKRIGLQSQDILGMEPGEVPRELIRLLNGDAHVAFPVPGSDRNDFMVRNIAAMDPENGLLAVVEQMEEGQKMMFVYRDDETVRADLSHTLVTLRQRIIHERGDFKPLAALYVSCVARAGVSFKADEGEPKPGGELALLREILGDIPITGFYANGEISNNRLYGYTGVLTLFL